MTAIKTGRPYTCKELFRVASMKGAALLTGYAGLDNPITSVNVMEVPDIADWTHPGEFLITTGYPFKDDTDRLFSLLDDLAGVGVAALGIKPHRFISEIPPEIIRYARERRFPLIELPDGANFSLIVQEVTRKILENDMQGVMALQSQVEIILGQFTAGKGLPEILSTLEDLTGYAVLLLCPGLEPIFGQAAKDLWDAQSAELRAALERRQLSVMQTAEGPKRVAAYPISWREHPGADLILIERDRSLQDSDRFLVEQLGGLLSLELRNQAAMEELRLQYRNRFWQMLLSGKLENAADIYLEAKNYGYPIDLDARYKVAVAAQIMGGEQPNDKALLQMSHLAHGKNGLMAAVLDGRLAVILEEGRDSREALRPLLDRLAGLFEGQGVSLCISQSYPIVSLAEGYREAVKVADISRRCGRADAFIEMKDLGVYAVLASLPESGTVEGFIRQMLEPLKAYDRKHNSMLCTTLKVYLQKGCNMKAAAAALYTHYNTITYRLDRIGQILELDVGDVETQFALRLALKLDGMRETTSEERREAI